VDRNIEILKAQVTLIEMCERITKAKVAKPTEQLKNDLTNILHLKEQFEHLAKMRELNAVAISNLQGQLLDTQIRLDQAEKMNEKLKEGL